MNLLTYKKVSREVLWKIDYFKTQAERLKLFPDQVHHELTLFLRDCGWGRLSSIPMKGRFIMSEEPPFKAIIHIYKEKNMYHSTGILLCADTYAGIKYYHHHNEKDSREEMEWLLWLQAIDHLESLAETFRRELGIRKIK